MRALVGQVRPGRGLGHQHAAGHRRDLAARRGASPAWPGSRRHLHRPDARHRASCSCSRSSPRWCSAASATPTARWSAASSSAWCRSGRRSATSSSRLQGGRRLPRADHRPARAAPGHLRPGADRLMGLLSSASGPSSSRSPGSTRSSSWASRWRWATPGSSTSATSPSWRSGAYAMGLMLTNGCNIWLAMPLAVLAGAVLRPAPRHPDAAPARGLLRDHHHRRGRDPAHRDTRTRTETTGGTQGLFGAAVRGGTSTATWWTGFDEHSAGTRPPHAAARDRVGRGARGRAAARGTSARTPWRRVLRAVRENEEAAAALGKNMFAYKLQALALGRRGRGRWPACFYTFFSTTLFPNQFEPDLHVHRLRDPDPRRHRQLLRRGRRLDRDRRSSWTAAQPRLPDRRRQGGGAALRADRPGDHGLHGLPSAGPVRQEGGAPSRCLTTAAPRHRGRAGGGSAACRRWTARASPCARASVTALIGPNGAGKTTRVQPRHRLHAPDAGRVRFAGSRHRRALPARDRAARHGAHVPAHAGAGEDDGARQRDARRARPAGREQLAQRAPAPGRMAARARREVRDAGARAAGARSASRATPTPTRPRCRAASASSWSWPAR